MLALDKFKVKVVSDDNKNGSFQIGPLPKGFGHTLGNTLRRILLSSIPGSAVTAVTIDGVKHEYSTMDGLQEDIITLVLGLKNLSVRKYSDDPVTIKLTKKADKNGTTVVTAADFDANSDVEIMNSDLYITTLSEGKDLAMEVTIESGIGYAYPDEEKRKEIGIIPIDSIFSPVKRVEVEVSDARLGQDTELDQINLDIYTNGTLTPSEAVLKAAELYDELANRLVNQLGGDALLAEQQIEEEVEEVEEVEEKILVSQLNLSTRLTNALLNSGISDLRLLRDLSREEVGNFKGMGKKSMTELEDIMTERGLTFSIS